MNFPLTQMLDVLHTLPGLLERFKASPDARESVVFAIWRGVAGGPLAKQSVPVKLIGRKLVIAVSDESWRKQMESLAGQLVYGVNAALGVSAVGFIEFRINEDAVKLSRTGKDDGLVPKAKFERSAMQRVSPEVRRAASAIADENLRRLFLLAAGGCVVRNLPD